MLGDSDRLFLINEEQCRQTDLLRQIVTLLEQSVWTCGCGHTNGVTLAACAQCGRRPEAKEQ